MTVLNSHDWQRIEAAIADLILSTDERYPGGWIGRKAYDRTFDKVNRINKTGKYTEPADTGKQFREIRKLAEEWANTKPNGSTTSVVLRDVGLELLAVLNETERGTTWLGNQMGMNR